MRVQRYILGINGESYIKNKNKYISTYKHTSVQAHQIQIYKKNSHVWILDTVTNVIQHRLPMYTDDSRNKQTIYETNTAILRHTYC